MSKGKHWSPTYLLVTFLCVAVLVLVGIRFLSSSQSDPKSESVYSLEQDQPTQHLEGIYVDRYLFTNNSEETVVPSSVSHFEGTLLSCEESGIADPTTVSESQPVPSGESIRLLFCSTAGITATISDEDDR